MSGTSFELKQAKIKSLDGQCRYEYMRYDYGKELFALQAIRVFTFIIIILAFPLLLFLLSQSKCLVLSSLGHNYYMKPFIVGFKWPALFMTNHVLRTHLLSVILRY